MKEVLATITSKGQVTIPVEVRRTLGLCTGDKVAFTVGESQVRLRKIGGSVVAATAGAFKSRQPAKTAEELRVAAEEAMAEEAGERRS